MRDFLQNPEVYLRHLVEGRAVACAETRGMPPFQSLYMRGAAFIVASIAFQWIGMTYVFGRNYGAAENDFGSSMLVSGVVTNGSLALLVIGIGIILISLWHQVARNRDTMG